MPSESIFDQFLLIFFNIWTDVNGKVVHLVQRPPPGSTPRAVSGNTPESRPRRHTDMGRNNMPIFQVIDGTVLGAMAIPMNTNSGVSKIPTIQL